MTHDPQAGNGLFDSPMPNPDEVQSFIIDADAQAADDVLSGPTALTTTSVHHHQAAPQGVIGEMLAYSKAATARDLNLIMRNARRTGEMLAGDAYYSWEQGGQAVEGPSIQLMEALQGVWGDLAVEAKILEIVETERGERMTVRVQVVDLINRVTRSNDQSFTLAPPPGKFSGKLAQEERWRAMELNKAISKAVRGCLEDIIPRYVVKAAMHAAFEVESAIAYASKDGQLSHKDACAGALTWATSKGLTQDDLEWKLGAELSLWTASDIITLRDLAERVRMGRTSIEGEWAAYRDTPPSPPATSTTSGGLSQAKKKGRGRTAGEE